jgi:hypothetical protein
MRHRTIGIGLLVAIIAAAVAIESVGQTRPGGGGGRGRGWGRNSPYSRLYDPRTVVTVEGEVAAVEQREAPNCAGKGVHLQLKTADGEIPVHLGPDWYVENQEPQIAQGDHEKVTGSRITYQDKPAVIAREVAKGDEVLVLRDEDGTPRWAGWRGRR